MSGFPFLSPVPYTGAIRDVDLGVRSLLAGGLGLTTTASKESATLGAEQADGTGWTSTGWTGDFATGFTHTPGNTSPLSRSFGATGTKRYQITFTVHNNTSGTNFTVTIGNSEPYDLYVGDMATEYQSAGITSISDGDLVFTPESDFDGRISDISVKEITAACDPAIYVTDSDAATAFALRAATADDDNIFFGPNSGQWNTTGKQNMAFGHGALDENTTGFWNCAIGMNALASNTVGSRNNAIGYLALGENITGQRNNAFGSWSQPRVTHGVKNCSFGADTLFYCTTGGNNVAFGYQSGYGITTGTYNCGFGVESVKNVTTQNYVVGLGPYAGNYADADYEIYIDNRNRGSAAAGRQDAPIYIATTAHADILNQIISLTGKVGIGTQSPKNKLSVHAGGAAPATSGTTSTGHVKIGGDYWSLYIGLYTDVDPKGPWLQGARADNLATKCSIMLQPIGGNVGIGERTPTARLHLGAGTATAGSGPLKLTSGVNLTTAEAGAFEYDGASLYFTRSGTVRERIGTIVTKIDTGDPTGAEGLFVTNTQDNTFKVYADGGWRQLATW